MSCCTTISDLATNIWYDLGQPTGQPPSYIQSRLISAPYIGKLNSLLATCYVAASGCISPVPDEDAQGIYSAMYTYDYYTTQLNRTLQGINGGGVISMSDGDSRIVLTSPVEVARMYRDAKNAAYDEMMTLIGGYRSNGSMPSSVDMPLIVNSLGAGDGYAGGEVALRGYYRS